METTIINRRGFFGALLGVLVSPTKPEPPKNLEFATKEFKVTTNFPLEQIFENQQLQYYEPFEVKPNVDIVIEGAVVDRHTGKEIDKYRCEIHCKEAEKKWLKL